MPRNQDEFRSEMPVTAERTETTGKATEIPNVTLMRNILDAFNRGDMDFVLSKMDEKVVWRFPGRHPLAEDYQGKEGVRRFLTRVGEESQGTIKPLMIAAFGDADYGVMFLHTTGDRKGKHLDIKEVLVFTVRNGLVTDVVHRPDPLPVDDFFS